MTLDDLNTIAWRDFLVWAWNEPEMRAQFSAATGVQIESVKAPINAAIDAATGASESLAARFIEWATREHWGVEHAPRAYQDSLAKKPRNKSSRRIVGNGG
ncbi:MAG TPA: hypothetical protein VLE97_11600 [Gaiellaceae bacterium]|nr:hypothetical protein [Gaiellaceae bacterium]